MGFKKFSLMLTIRTAMIMLTLILMSYLITVPGYHAATLLLTLILIAQCISAYQFVARTNAELVRFFNAARYADYSQRFELSDIGAGFGELGRAFTDILKRFQEVRAHQEEELRHLKAIIEHVPVPLISLHGNQDITLWNNAARRLFGSNKVTRLEDLTNFGQTFSQHLSSLTPGERRLVNFAVDGMEHQLTVSATQIIIAGKTEKLISMQDIQSELDGAQLQAWQDLVRVLTHEIMNSITPVASLAKTAVDLLDDAKSKVQDHADVVEDLSDVSDAVQTVARRSDGLTKFVGSYRRLTRLPPPNKKRIKLTHLFDQVDKLATQQWQQKGISLSTEVLPQGLEIDVDIDMIEQLLINLLQNAEQALAEVKAPEVTMAARLNKRGHVVIEVADNGPGIADDIADKIFVPFFTTKREGSGVGLALTRQVMIAHGGNVKLDKSDSGGALFRLTF